MDGMVREPNVGGSARRERITEMSPHGICRQPRRLRLGRADHFWCIQGIADRQNGRKVESVRASMPSSATTSVDAPAFATDEQFQSIRLARHAQAGHVAVPEAGSVHGTPRHAQLPRAPSQNAARPRTGGGDDPRLSKEGEITLWRLSPDNMPQKVITLYELASAVDIADDAGPIGGRSREGLLLCVRFV
jgi:hypothetical protein